MPTNARTARRAIRSVLFAALTSVISITGTATAQTTDVVTYYHTDAIGSVRMITDQNQQVVERHDYLPFGEEWTSPTPERREFAGKERDAETGLDYFGARYYSNGSGRFTTVDPFLDIEQALVDPQRWNRYAYVTNNPFRFVDPDGKQAVEVGVAVVLGVLLHQAHLNAPAPGAALVDDRALTEMPFEIAGGQGILAGGSAVESFLSRTFMTAGARAATGAARYLPEKIAENFVGPVHRLVLQNDATAFRYVGGGAGDIGSWLTTSSTVKNIKTAEDAIRALNLPKNTAERLLKLRIPKGTEIFVGRIRSGADWAVQIWVREKDNLQLLGEIPY